MTYNMPTNVTGIGELMQNANMITSGLFGIVIILLTFLIAFFSLMGKYPASKSFATASFLTSIIASLLWFMSMATNFVVLLCFVAFGISLVMLHLEGRTY